MRTLKHQQYVCLLRDNLTRWVKRKSRKIKTELVEAALILMGLDLDCARDILQPLYSENPRGRKPYDAVTMLRALLLMVILKYKSLGKFANDLKAKPRLAKIAGFFDDDVPVAGTFYLFIVVCVGLVHPELRLKSALMSTRQTTLTALRMANIKNLANI